MLVDDDGRGRISLRELSPEKPAQAFNTDRSANFGVEASSIVGEPIVSVDLYEAYVGGVFSVDHYIRTLRRCSGSDVVQEISVTHRILCGESRKVPTS